MEVDLVLTVLLSVLFVLWFAVSVAAQFGERAGERLGRLDIFGLIPRWTFFAPRPGMHDIHLLYRDRLNSGELSRLSLVASIERRHWYHAVWNPWKARNKVVLDVMMSLGRQYLELEKRGLDSRLVLLYPSYLMALHLVMREERPPDAVARQFVLARSHGFRNVTGGDIIVASELHRFEQQ